MSDGDWGYEAAWGAMFAHHYTAAIAKEPRIEPGSPDFSAEVRSAKSRCAIGAAALASDAIQVLRTLDNPDTPTFGGLPDGRVDAMVGIKTDPPTEDAVAAFRRILGRVSGLINQDDSPDEDRQHSEDMAHVFAALGIKP